MKPNPLSSLNHFTVPVGMWESSTICACCYAEDAAQSFDLRALALLSPVLGCRPYKTTVAGPHRRLLQRCCTVQVALCGSSMCQLATPPGPLRWTDGRAAQPGARARAGRSAVGVQAPRAGRRTCHG